jgi:hypothetical protein
VLPTFAAYFDNQVVEIYILWRKTQCFVNPKPRVKQQAKNAMKCFLSGSLRSPLHNGFHRPWLKRGENHPFFFELGNFDERLIVLLVKPVSTLPK